MTFFAKHCIEQLTKEQLIIFTIIVRRDLVTKEFNAMLEILKKFLKTRKLEFYS